MFTFSVDMQKADNFKLYLRCNTVLHDKNFHA